MHEPVTVQLNRVECLAALEAGLHLHLNAVGESFKQLRTGSITSWDIPLNEALAKAAVRKWLNGRDNVRARAAIKDYGNLVISETDAPGEIICLVSCYPPVFKIEGYVRVADAQMKTECLANTMGGRRWWIKREELRDPRELGNG